MARRDTGFGKDKLDHLIKLETIADVGIYRKVYAEHIFSRSPNFERLKQVLLFRNTYEDVKAKIGVVQALVETIYDPVEKALEGKTKRRLDDTTELVNILNDNILQVAHTVLELMKSSDNISSSGIIALNEFVDMIPLIKKCLFLEILKVFNNLIDENKELIDDIKMRAARINKEMKES